MDKKLSFVGKRVLLGFSFFLLIVFSVFSQTHTAKTVSINSNCNGYYEYLPINYSSSSSLFPVIIYCGGAGTFGSGTSSQLAKLLAEGPPYYINNNQFPKTITINGETTSYIVISPQFVNWPSPNDVEAVLNYILAQNYKIDRSRIYLAGFSAGGDVTWKYPNTSVTRAKRLAAIVPVSAFNNPYVDTGAKYIAQANLPVWALHSNDDQTAPAYWSQNFVNKVNSFSPAIRAKITRFNGVAHDPTKNYVYNPTYRDGGYSIYEWLLLYRRNYPPNAAAGADVNISLPANSVIVNGNASTDPENTLLTYRWSKVSGPSQYIISNNSNVSTSISNLVAGIYNFELLVTDADGYTDTDTVRITVTNPFPNQLPVANAGNDISISLPQSSFTLNGSSSSDAGGVIETFSWSKIAGPSSFTITNPASSTTSVTNLKKGIYLFKLSVTDNEGGTSNDTIQVTVINPFPNISPISNAGSDQSITLPTENVTLNGSASSDADGEIISYLWSQVAGPATASITNASQAVTVASNLQAGLYRFELRVIDDSNAVSRDTMEVAVLPAPSVTNKYLRVNLFGGTNPYNQDGWNNWNVTGTNNITSGNFNYSDGTSSSVNAILSYSQGVSDNGASYGGSMCPPQVLRYTTNSTASSRTVTLRGLNNTFKYDIELFASRSNTGNSTQFVINGVSKTIVTDNNLTQKVVFTDLTPSNGQIVISLNKVGTFTYLNGFVLIEKSLTPSVGLPPVARAGDDIAILLPTNTVQLNGSGSYDTDGSIASYAWSKISGPSAFSIVNPAQAITSLTNLIEGTYKFELRVTDNSGNANTDTLQVIVGNAGDTINCGKPFTIVILGSSTAYGTGANPIDSSWANKFANYAYNKNAQTNIINLATLSLNSYHVLCPTGSIPPANRPSPDSMRNITKALQFNPDAIIINLPTNDIGLGYTLQEISDNYERTMQLANAAQIPVWVTTSQPRTNLSATERSNLMLLRDWTYQRFGPKAIDFWTDVANADGTINESYSAGDNVHVNNLGHQLFFVRMIGERIFDTLCLRTNQKPIANAGSNQSITLPANSVQLNGSASNDPDGIIVSRLWTKVAGPAQFSIASPSASITNVNNLSAGTYSFELLVTDNSGASARDTVIITVASGPQPPVANAGADQAITLPANNVILNGSGSFDSDGTISYLWSKIAGPASYTISDISIVNPVVSNLQEGIYQFELLITDNDNLTARDTIVITVSAVPVFTSKTIKINLFGGTNPYNTDGWNNWNVTGTNNITSSNFTYSDASVSGINAILSYSQGIADNGSTYGGTMCPPQVLRYGTYSTASTRTLTIRGLNNSLTYDFDFFASRNNTGNTTAIVINGVSKSVVTDNNKDNKISFTGISPANGQIVISVNKASGTYSYLNGLTIIERSLSSEPTNLAPVANAGPDQTITLPVNSVQLNGSASSDPDGSIATYAWSKISGPASFTIVNAGSAITNVTNLTAGSYSFELLVTDNGGLSKKDTVNVQVNSAAQQAPVANAGPDQTITLPVNSVQLNGSASSDSDGTIATYAWSKISGPASFTIVNAGSAITNVTNLTAGSYSFELLVTDNSGLSKKDTVNVQVNSAAQQDPVANAGPDQTITLPVNSVQLNGSASSDPDGTIASYAWSKISGPASFTIVNAGNAITNVTNLTAGSYSFELLVTDNSGLSKKDTVNVQVNSAAQQAPVANAGPDQTITLPVNSVQLNGSASSDPDGSIVSYNWNKIEGPTGFSLTNNSSTPTVSNLEAGIYKVELTVTDNSGLTAKDTVTITVSAASTPGKIVKVNIYGGSNAYTSDGWNNWTIASGEVTNITSSNFLYSDGLTSPISAVLSYSQGVADNGTSYGGTMCPPQVLRYGSFSTASTRTLTIRGLNNALKYDFEFYASRNNTGNTTGITINGTLKSVVTDNNKSNKISFTDIIPVNGQITITVNKVAGTYSYLNGLQITEK